MGRRRRLLTTEDGGALVRVIAGDVAGHQGPGSTFTPITLVHATISPTAEMKLPWRSDFNALVYFLAGEGYAGEQLAPVRSGQLVVFGPGDYLQIGAARSQDSASPNVEVLVLGGPAYPRTGCPLRAVRHEHQRGDRPGDAGLPGRAPREDPG